MLQIRHETLRIAVIAKLEDYLGMNPDGSMQPDAALIRNGSYEDGDSSLMEPEGAPFEPFKDMCKRRFMWYYDSYMASIEVEQKKVTEGQQFVRMPFEHSGNAMEGKFLYKDLKRRLEQIRKQLDTEAENWAEEGLQAVKQESGVAANLQRQYEQTVEFYKREKSVNVDVELVDGNPFVWRAVSYLVNIHHGHH